MAVNRIRGAFAVPRKGETFELRAGLVYVSLTTHLALTLYLVLWANRSVRISGRNTPTRGIYLALDG